MKKIITPLILFYLILFVRQANAFPNPQNGELDLRSFNFNQKGQVSLTGEWLFYDGVFLSNMRKAGQDMNIMPIEVPSDWARFSMKEVKDGIGFGTYSLRINKPANTGLSLVIQDISSAYKIWLNQKEVFSCGSPGTIASESEPKYCHEIIQLPTDTTVVDIWIEVSNFHQSRGGILQSPQIIITKQASLKKERESLYRYFCFGILFIIGFYHIGLWVLNRENYSAVLFGLFCLVLLTFLVFRSRLVFRFYPDLSWNLGMQLEYIMLCISIPLFYLFFYQSFRGFFRRFFALGSAIFGIIGSLFITFTKPIYFTPLLTIIHVVLLIYIPLVLVGLIKAISNKAEGARIILAGFLLFMTALVNDILHVQNIIHTGNVIMFGIVAFILCQAYFLAYASNKSRIRNLFLSDSLQTLNISLNRFVPQNFIKLLDKNSITQVMLGNCTEREMTIMFSDIRSFTSISEKLSPANSFKFINDYLQVMAPIIKKNKGFIDKYIGDGIMALFPEHPDHALKASLEMMEALKEFNKKNSINHMPAIAIGIGLHYGNVILGTVGEPDRMDTTVISDAVNLAARIESLTKHYKVPIIISQDTFNRLSEQKAAQCSYIGKATVKGKTIETDLFSVHTKSIEEGYNTTLPSPIHEEFEY